MPKKTIVTKRVHSSGKSKIVKKTVVFDKKINNLAKRTAAKANQKKKTSRKKT